MNNAVISHTQSRESGIHLDVSPLGDNEYVVKFVLPEGASVQDVQYVLELSGGSNSEAEVPAKFTIPPNNGGMGCEGKRVHGKAGAKDTAAVVAVNEDAKHGSTLVIRGGWATGHEAVTLTDSKVIVVGQQLDNGGTGGGGVAADEEYEYEYEDDQLEAEHEEEIIEEERNAIQEEIESAEMDAVEALEEKRIETDGLGAEIKAAEEEIVEALESNRKDMNKALNALKDEIIINKAENEASHKAKMMEMQQNRKAQMEKANQRHRENKHPHDGEQLNYMLQYMEHRFKDEHDPRKEQLDHLLDMKNNVKDSVNKLKAMDRAEHERARREHLKPLPKEELDVDIQELKQKAKEKLAQQRLNRMSESLGVGVNELFKNREMKEVADRVRGHLQKGIPRGGAAVYHGDKGEPLSPKARHFLLLIFAMFISVGLLRWYLDKRRRTTKGRTL
ncbi:predicted protein [Thalassiosira pseudonana CCMP1335]|uniref:Uncharacterized protein n=1 Tax=Thalassiosira pseudonana TaxID=35128 RepID=B8C226_THAPS|nr:predicted protein [Thalassiosira pseudonana CCMP1335]EED91867.1 predicted protein [Thalassiosira pseudonana CCMP1335]